MPISLCPEAVPLLPWSTMTESFSVASHTFLPSWFYSLEKNYGLLSPSISKNPQVVIICCSLWSKDAITDRFYGWALLPIGQVCCSSLLSKALRAVQLMGEPSYRHDGSWLHSTLDAGRVNNIIFCQLSALWLRNYFSLGLETRICTNR